MASALLTTSNLPRFRKMIVDWEAKQTPPTGFSTPLSSLGLSSLESAAGIAQGSDSGMVQGRKSKEVLVAFRTRPPLPGEAEEKFQALESMVYKGAPLGEVAAAKRKQRDEEEAELAKIKFCPGLTVRSAEPGVVIAHVPAMKWNGPVITQKKFEADIAFGPEVENDEVYARTVRATDMLSLVLNGGVGCVLAYGQTGAGKTHTMEALEARVANDLFPKAEELSQNFLESHTSHSSKTEDEGERKNIFEISASFLELLNKRATDLLDVPEEEVGEDGYAARKEVLIHENKLGEVRPGLIQTVVHSSEELQDIITRALSHRRTSATLRNASSSRSHAVLTLRVKNTLLPYVDEGVLLLVDLAGSERYEDSKAHDKQRMEESRENNITLMCLKDCVRAKAKAVVEEEGFVHIPFRSNKLTLLLKPIFDLEARQQTKTVIIAHTSPHIQDSVHSVSTLNYAAPFKTSPPKRSSAPLPYEPSDPRTWNHKQSKEWIESEIKKRSAPARSEGQKTSEDTPDVQSVFDVDQILPESMTARAISRIYANEWVERCLKARKEDASNPFSTEDLKMIAVQVYGQFNYLLLTARLKSRNAVIKSRKKVDDVKETYGDIPTEGVAARDPDGWTIREAEFSDEDYMLLKELHGEELAKLTEAGRRRLEEEGKDWAAQNVHSSMIRVQLLEKYREEIEQEKSKGGTGPVIKARREYERIEE